MRITVRTARFVQGCCVVFIFVSMMVNMLVDVPDHRWVVVGIRICFMVLAVEVFRRLEHHIYTEQLKDKERRGGSQN